MEIQKMTIPVSFSPKPSVFTPCNTTTSSLPRIICSSKRKKNAAKQKALSPAKTATKLKLSQHEDDMLLGIGAGASTLTALQPRLEEEEESAMLPLGPQALTAQSPLSRFILAESSSSAFPGNSKIAHELPEDEDEYEWVEVNIEDENRNLKASVEDKCIFWEGGSQSMTEEEETELLKNAQRELARLQAKKAKSKSQSLQYEYIFEEEDVDDTYRDVQGHDNASMDTGDIPEDDILLSEAEAELALFEESVRKVKNSTKFLGVDISMHDTSEQEDKTEENEGDESAEAQSRKKPAKRAIPAVMRSFDRAKIYVKAGNGGNGVVAFRREKYVPFGGPSGGSGGRGGHVYVEADPSMNSLLSFRKSVHFRAGRGSHGQGKSQDGATGEDCVVKVPLGTVIRETSDDPSEHGNVLIELMRPYQRELLLPGGRGGRGNAAFKTGRNKTPQLAENGEEGADMWIELELKLVADVGIIGVPNAGKSTLLSVISAAQPAIGAYPFTTLLPNLGVVPIGFEASMVVADLPGLLEGAHLGIGLGHEFLRHTERCRILVHVVDGMSQQPEQEYEAVRLELDLFNPALSEKPYIVAFNKMDIPEAAERWHNFQAYMEKKGIEAVCISAATKIGTQQVITKAYSLLQTLPAPSYEDTRDDQSDNMAIGELVRRQRNAPIEEFEIICDKQSRIWRVEGVGLERFTQMTNWEYFEAMRRFQQVLNMIGVNKALREKGVSEGDTVVVGEMEFIWHDSEDLASTEWKRGFRGSRLWPH